MAFLDRFAPAPRHAAPAADGDGAPDRVRDVLANLNHVLNTRRGYGWFRQDFGMSDPDPHASPACIAEAVMRDVRENIERYEPRVRVLDIVTAAVESPMRIAFTVRCMVLDDARSLRVELDTVFKRFSVGSRP